MSNFYNLELLPGDRLIVPKSGLDAVQHHAIYAGNGYVYENVIGKGVIITHMSHFFKGVTKITAIKRFAGNNYQRQLAIVRAESQLGRSYNLLSWNCEHFADYVQHGQPKSRQVENAVGISAVALLLWATTRALR